MKAMTKIIFLDDAGERFFGEGPARLLHEIEITGSLRAAAISMGMAYTKALKLLKHAEDVLGYPLATRSAGGKHGGGSKLTPDGKAWLIRYEAYRNACIHANQKLYLKYYKEKPYGHPGCVIMASGLGKRFGDNKLMADFHGRPLIDHVLSVTEAFFSERVVVTRHPDVAQFCQKRHVKVLLHDQPFRSDTVRLGLQALDASIDSCVFFQGDQPLLKPETIASLLLSAQNAPTFIWRTACKEHSGSPILFPKWIFPELLSLPQGEGGNYLAKKYPEHVHTVQVQDISELKDVDTPKELQALLNL